MMTRIYADADGCARFEDVPLEFVPADPPPDVMAVSAALPAAAVLFGRGPAGGSHPEQPEHRRQLIIGVSGSVEITATAETRTFGPGDIPLVEDTTGTGHASRSPTGFTAAVVVLS